MKKLMVIVLGIFWVNGLFAQDCKNIKTGRFFVAPDTYSPSETLVTRTNQYQYEEVKSEGIKIQFRVQWTSDCTYELSRGKVLKGDVPFLSPDHVLHVKIIKVTPKSYTTLITSNFSDTTLEKEIQVLDK